MSNNMLLARLTRADALLLQPHLEYAELPVRTQLQAAKRRVERVYFLESGVASMVANGDIPIEVGMIGREGMTGASLLLGGRDRFPHEVYMQIAGSGMHMAADQLRVAIAQSTTLHQVLLKCVNAFLIQATLTAMSNGRNNVEERLSRWLLLARDRVDHDEMKLTHEFLSVMLGVRRSGITMALQELERRALIANRRSLVTILDREGLEQLCKGSYLPPEDD